MADTIRDRAAIIALFPDNTSGEISPQDERDLIVSAWGVYGAISFITKFYSKFKYNSSNYCGF